MTRKTMQNQRAYRNTEAILNKGMRALAQGDALSVTHSTAFQVTGQDLALSPDAFMRLESGPKPKAKSKITLPKLSIQKKEP